MSELYEHLKKLEEKERRIRDEGMPAPVPVLGREKPNLRRPFRGRLVGIPAAFIVLGLLAAFAVMELKKTTLLPRPSTPVVAPQIPAVENFGQKSQAPPTPQPLALLETQNGEKPGTPRISIALDGGIGRPSLKEETSGISELEKSMEAEREVSGPSTEPMMLRGSNEGVAFSGGDEKKRQVQPITPNSGPASSDKETVRIVKDKPRTRKAASENKAFAGSSSVTGPPFETSRQALVIAEEARQRGDWEEAERGYREYLATQKDPLVMNNLGAVLLARGLYGEAEQVLSRAYAQSSDPEIAANLCISLWAQGKKDDACRLVVSLSEGSSISRPAPAVQRLLHYCRPER